MSELPKMPRKIPKGLGVKLFLTNPPYNIGHKYGTVSDRSPKEEYLKLMEGVLNAAYTAADDSAHFFMIHYPEAIAEMWPIWLKKRLEISSVDYMDLPSNIGMSSKRWTRASRAVIWLQKGKPDFFPNRIIRPYRNPWDNG